MPHEDTGLAFWTANRSDAEPAEDEQWKQQEKEPRLFEAAENYQRSRRELRDLEPLEAGSGRWVERGEWSSFGNARVRLLAAPFVHSVH